MKRSRLQFSLRSLLILTTLLGCVFAYVGWRLQATRREAKIAAQLRDKKLAVARENGWVSTVLCYQGSQLVTLSDDDVRLIGQLPHIEVLVLWGGNPNDPDKRLTDDGLVQLGKHPSLTTLSLARTKITDSALACEAIRQLRWLDLSSTAVTDKGLVQLGRQWSREEGKPSADRHLFLANTKITDTGLAHLEKVECLSVLDLSSTAVTDEGLAHVARMWRPVNGKPPLMCVLRLQDTAVTDAGLAFLEDVDCRDLELDVSRTNVTKAGWERLSAAGNRFNRSLDWCPQHWYRGL